MGHPDRPPTQFDMLALAGAKSPTMFTERAVLFDSLNSRPTPKGDASSKTATPSLADTPDAVTRTGKAESRTVRPATSGPLQLRAAWESPWEKYEKVYNVELGGTVEVAIRKASFVELVHVRAFLTEVFVKTLYLFRQLQYQNIVTALEVFTIDNGLYTVLEYMPVFLERIVRLSVYPDERQLVAILGQVCFRNPFKNIH